MSRFIKHVGQTIDTNKKCVVVFRSLPGEELNCLVVETETLPPNYHDNLIEAVESPSAQEELDFYKFASRSTFHDGTNMLSSLHQRGWLKKRPVDQIEMIPSPDVAINLKDLNKQLDEISSPADKSSEGVLSNSQIANQMRSQAAFFRKEAERLYAEADALDPQTTAAVADPVVEAPKQSKAGRPKKKQ